MKKILIITYYFPPSGGAGVQRALKFVKYLPQFGIEPIVLTVDENKASYPLVDSSLINDIPKEVKVYKTDSFEALNILSKLTSKKNIPYGGFSGQNKEKSSQKILRFIRGNFFIPDARIGWVKYAYDKASEIIENEKIDTIFISSPPHSSQLIGIKLKKKYPHIKWIADLRDPWTDIYYYKDMMHTTWAKRKDERLELKTIELADEILVVSDAIKRMLAGKSSNIKDKKIHVIPNGFDEVDFNGIARLDSDEFLITYVGTISDVYYPAVFFESLKKLIENHPEDKIKFRFVGSISPAVSNAVETYKLKDKCEFISQVSHSKAIEYMVSSTALLLVIPEVENNKGILTGKLFEYLNTRNPIIGIGPVDGDASIIMNDCHAGKMFNRNQSVDLSDYLEALFTAWKQNHESILNTHNITKYSRKAQAKELAALIS